ncbi:MAG: hypothetical protein WAK82_11275, partial [Streptosporangiaceae bacterium]
MTQNKAQKSAARQRMSETGEPYSVARHAVQKERAADESAGPAVQSLEAGAQSPQAAGGSQAGASRGEGWDPRGFADEAL